MTNIYESPLSSRYASEYMKELFSSDTRYKTWRKLWVALAKAEKELGIPITDEQIKEMQNHIDDIDYECVSEREKEVRHDVMAHVYAFGKVAPSAAGIIHLGATSCFVTDNADLILYRDALTYIRGELLKVIANLCDFAEKYKEVPTLGYTHYQPAQLVTVGKRATLWLQDFVSDIEEIDFVLRNIKFLGSRGTTGTEASFVHLFNGDTIKIDVMNKKISNAFG
ncbi:MAG: adenylosuccinate lyase, partial [Clostridia bacterium]|nr:adenylosuccinate lyase [Clostridia bacterium]